MSSPRVEIGGIRLHVFGTGTRPVGMEDEFVGREKEAAEGTLDALGSRRIVTGRQEGAATPPSTLVVH
jgi:hypothetical protein